MRKKILVVDDEPHIVKAIRYYLEDEGYEVLAAEEGVGAIELAERERPDLVILDVMMPRMDGFEVCRELRARSRTRLIPIIFLSARESVEDKLTGFELGADDYVTKPFNNRELLARIRSRIRRSEDGLSSHPVSGLPGGGAVERESGRRLRAGRPFCAVFIRLDGLEQYRRAYGAERSRALLGHLARLISSAFEEGVEEGEGERDFLGHASDEEFVVFTSRPRAGERCRRIASLYGSEEAGFPPGPAAAAAEAAHAPPPRLAIACLHTGSRSPASHAALSAWAAEALARARAGGACVLEE